MLRHNLDVMHVEKNVFDNIFNIVMNFKDKTKDNVRSREDMKILCKRPNLKLIHLNEKCIKPKSIYARSNDQRKCVLQWIKQLKFPDGYAANISRCVNVEEAKLRG